MWVVVRKAEILLVVFSEERDVCGRRYVPAGRARCIGMQGLCRRLCVQCSFLSIGTDDEKGICYVDVITRLDCKPIELVLEFMFIILTIRVWLCLSARAQSLQVSCFVH